MLYSKILTPATYYMDTSQKQDVKQKKIARKKSCHFDFTWLFLK